MDLGPHAAFIWGAYAATAVLIGGLLAWSFADGARQRKALSDLEARGARRRGSDGAT